MSDHANERHDRASWIPGLMAGLAAAALLAAPVQADFTSAGINLSKGTRAVAHTVQEGGFGFYSPPKTPDVSFDLGNDRFDDRPDELRIIFDLGLPEIRLADLPASDVNGPIFDPAIELPTAPGGGTIGAIPAPGVLGLLGLGLALGRRRRARA